MGRGKSPSRRGDCRDAGEAHGVHVRRWQSLGAARGKGSGRSGGKPRSNLGRRKHRATAAQKCAGTGTERRTIYGGGEVRSGTAIGNLPLALVETNDHLGNVRELLDATGTIVPFRGQQLNMAMVRRINGCEGEPQQWGDTKGALLYPSKNGTPFVSYIHCGGHNYATEAPGLIVRFLKEHAKKVIPESTSPRATGPRHRTNSASAPRKMRKRFLSIAFM